MLLALAIGSIGSVLAIVQVTVPILQPQPYRLPSEEPPAPSLLQNVSFRNKYRLINI